MMMDVKVFKKPEDVLTALQENDAVFVYDGATPERVENARSLSVGELLNMLELENFHECCFFTFEETSSF